MPTANNADILTDALILVGAYAQGQTPNTDDMALALRTANRMLSSLSTEKLAMMGMKRSSFTLTGAGSYTYGPGQTWNATTRPIKIKEASVVAANGVERPCNLPTADQWAAIPDKTRTGIYVEDLFYDNGFPTGNIYVSPMPATGNVVLWTYEAIPYLTGTTGTVNLLDGYERMLVVLTAAELCISFQRPLTQELAAAAMQAKQAVAQLNAELYNAPAPPPAGPGPTAPPALRTA